MIQSTAIQSVVVIPRQNRCDQYDGKTLLVSCSVNYPLFVVLGEADAPMPINQTYQAFAADQCERCAGELRESAQADFADRQKSGFPFNPYEVLTKYCITYNRDCTLSLYMDTYTFTGGAHGVTVRTSDTWSLETMQRLALSALFPENPNHQAEIIAFIQAKVTVQMVEGEGLYYEDSPSLVPQAFNPEQFYLTPSGLTFYFQQYDIAPYAAGILEFSIPWGALGATQPQC